MRRIRVVLAVAAAMAMMVLASVAPAMAAENNNHNANDFRFNDSRFHDLNDGFFFNPFFFDRFGNRFFDNGFNNGIAQNNEQDVQSGDATQNIDVTGGGDNSNQCVGVQGVNNTGNATNNTGVLQANNGNRFDNRSFDNNRFDNRFFDGRFFDNGSNGGDVQVQDTGNFTISPSQTTTCDQQVNQAASAFGS